MRQSKTHMLDRPYIKNVINELQEMGYDEAAAKAILTKYCKPLKRNVGLDPNAKDFAKELVTIAKAVERKHNPTDPNQIFIGDLKDRILQNNKKSPALRVKLIPGRKPLMTRVEAINEAVNKASLYPPAVRTRNVNGKFSHNQAIGRIEKRQHS